MVERRLICCLLLGAAATALSAQAPFAAKLKDPSGKSSVVVYKSGKAETVPDSADLAPLSWSPDGRWLVLGREQGNGFNLFLVDSTAGTLSACPLSGVCSPPSWAPSGKAFVASVQGGGLRVCEVTGSDPVWTPLVSSGTNPSWSPTGGRIAFVVPQGGASGWITDQDGAGARAFYKPSGAEFASWAPDGKSLALVVGSKQGKQLVIVTPTGSDTKNLAKVDTSETSWSPDGQSLLAKQKGRWSVINARTGSVTETDLLGAMPQWIDSKTLACVQKGAVGEFKLKDLAFRPWPFETAPSSIQSVTVFRGLVLEGGSSAAKIEPPKPEKGQLVLLGTVKNVEMDEDTAQITVWSVLSPDGMELNLAQPLIQNVQITPGSTRIGPNGKTKLMSADLFIDGEIMALVDGERAGVSERLSVAHVIVPELLEAGAPSDMALEHPVRILDYDGVSMDHVLVPMVFPVAGDAQWSDTFLADRAGGARRHHGQDLMAPKLRPLVATFDGTVRLNRSAAGHYTIRLRGDNGWSAVYMHVNNDNPGTDDGKGGPRYAFAPGLKNGDRVVQGQLIGYCGDSGNAEGTAPHCHFELHDDIGGGVLNAAPSLAAAERLSEPLVPAPSLALGMNAGDTRWDVLVTKVDPVRNVVVGELVAFGGTDGKVSSPPKPRLVYIKVAANTLVALRNQINEVRKFEDLKPGQFLTALGSVAEEKGSMEARFVGLGSNLSQ